MQRLRILVVEDERLIRELMVEGLSQAGFDVDQAGDSDTAARLLDSDGYRLLVTDVNMPGTLDGLQLAERIHAVEANLPIIIATARPDIGGRFKQAGIRGAVLIKPYKLSRLVKMVLNLIGPEPSLGSTPVSHCFARRPGPFVSRHGASVSDGSHP